MKHICWTGLFIFFIVGCGNNEAKIENGVLNLNPDKAVAKRTFKLKGDWLCIPGKHIDDHQKIRVESLAVDNLKHF